MNKIYLIKIRL